MTTEQEQIVWASPEARRAEARRLTELLEANSSFSYLRLGDGEVQGLLAVMEGKAAPRYQYRDEQPVTIDQAYSVSGIPMRNVERLMSAYGACSYLDFCELRPAVAENLDRIGIVRQPNGYSNPDPGCSHVLFEWTYYELKDYLAQHTCLMAGAEAALLRELTNDPRYVSLAADFWPADAKVDFHQVRDNGRNYSENLDLIKQDLIDDIRSTGADTLMLCLASGAKILCQELCQELGIRAIDFGSMMRALSYSGSPGYQSNRSYHNPFFFRVPLDIYLPALERANPDMPVHTRVSKSHAQLALTVQYLRPLQWNPTDSCEGGALEFSAENLRNFADDRSWYNRHYLPLTKTDTEAAKLHAAFRHWRWRLGLGWDGKVFRLLLRIKGLARSCLKPMGLWPGSPKEG